MELQPTGPCRTIYSFQRENASTKGHSPTGSQARIKLKGLGCYAMPLAAALNWLTALPHLDPFPWQPCDVGKQHWACFLCGELAGGPWGTGTTLETWPRPRCCLLQSVGSRGPHQNRCVSFLLSISRQIEMFGISLKMILGFILFKELCISTWIFLLRAPVRLPLS